MLVSLNWRVGIESLWQIAAPENALYEIRSFSSGFGTGESSRLVELSEIQAYSPGDTAVAEGSLGDATFCCMTAVCSFTP
jgi:hypothetical protein